jgi:hypothetical protein
VTGSAVMVGQFARPQKRLKASGFEVLYSSPPSVFSEMPQQKQKDGHLQ